MKKLLFLMLLMFSLAGYSQEARMATLFRAMPDSILPLLTKNNRLDFVDYLENKMQAKVRNRFDETAEMTALDENYLHIQMSPVSEVEMQLLPQTDSLGPVVCLLRSYKAPARESVAEFYDDNWNRLYWIEVPSPKVEDCMSVVPDSLQNDRDLAVAELEDMPIWSITVDRELAGLVFDLQIVVLPKELCEKISPYVTSLKYQWDGMTFVMKK